MRPAFRPRLVNGPFDDPGLYVDILFERRALLFDLGDAAALQPRQLLRVSDVFVTHTHMDHFVGFDRLLRVCLGRERPIALYGPPGFIDQVEHRLAAYTWNLVENYAADLALTVHEMTVDGRLHGAAFRSRERFRRRALPDGTAAGGLLLDEPAFAVRACLLDHKTPCLGLALEEKAHANVWKNRLAGLGVAAGPWLRDLKRAALAGLPDDAPITARWREAGAVRERTLTLGELQADALRIVPGQKICYVTDVAWHEDNARRIAALAANADLLYIEATFLDADADEAARKAHLTARQAGQVARRAGARRVVPFHFSPRYADHEDLLRAELAAAFGGPVDLACSSRAAPPGAPARASLLSSGAGEKPRS